ncbi:Condensin-2 complex subunit D3 [Sciurus carolinensis]|uniref:Condensin-2 complex subunit D3 n=1 Tax=Sciurus carolinensis TaxID=30640 RepID=A0AA41MI67_SCICA|nr:Condensin-2 complex subunit D3 [Sciurus carolinensis]
MVALRGLGSGLQPWCPLDLSLEWVDTVWELDFTETEPLDSSIEAEIIETGLNAFTKLYESLFPFATEEHDSSESIWTFFIENNISHSTLVALFYHFVQIVHSKNVNVQYREYGLHAAGLYFLLLEVPGSVANQVFHPVMFDKCIQILKKSWPQESNLNRKRKKEQPKSTHGNPRGNRKRGKPLRKEDTEMDEIIEEEDDEENICYSARDLSQIRNAIFHLLKNFLRLLPKFSLKEKPQNLNEAKYMPELAYRGLYLLCSPIHGEGDKVIDKSEYRTSAAQSLVQLLSKLPSGEYATFIAWLYKYSRSSKIPHRVFTLDVVLALLELPEREMDGTLSLEHQKFLKHKFLVQEIMFDRCLDKAPTVRSKALSSFAHCLELSISSASESVLELLVNTLSYQRQMFNPSEPPGEINIDNSGEVVGSRERCVMAMLRKRIRDEKTNVRKSAVQVLVNILKHCDILSMEEDLSILQDHCRDPAVSVRKQALQSLTELLMAQPRCVLIQKTWLMGVIPVVMDCESTVQEKALECLDQLLLQNIKHHSKFHGGDDNQVLAWSLLALLTTESQELSQQNPNSNTLGHILCVIGHIAKHLPKSTRDKVIDVVKCKLNGFQWSLELISSAVDTLQRLCRASAKTPVEEQELLKQVCGNVLSTCEYHLSNIVLKENGAGNMDEDLLVKYIFTLGDIAQLCPAKVEKRVFLLIQSILASSADVDHLPSSQGTSDAPAIQPPSQVKGSVMPSVIRAHAIITLGKLCLQHEDLAKKSIPALVRELEVCEDVAVRNNVIIVMCDLCIRYTVMVDKYIPNISMCLKDSDPFIRKQTLILLTNLLQEEFVKWKGSLFFRFVSTLIDSHPDIARFGEFCLAHLLLKRNPVMFFQHFIECIFHFNNYEKHEKYNKFPQSEREKRLFSLKGKTNKERRMKIYKFLLEHFTDEQRFNITSKICLSILACFADGILPLDMDASELLSDTFEVLSSKEIKLLAMRAKPDKDLLMEEDDMALANVVMQEAQKKLISQVQKRNFIENIIPIIISLKTVLEKNKIPALRELMNYLREVMQDYRDEIKDFFAVDKQLASELEYDMKKYNEQLAQEQELAKQGALGLNIMPVPSGQENANVSPATSRPSASGSSTGHTTTLPLTPETGPLKMLMPSARPMSLSTIAILKSVKKAVESKSRHRSRSLGVLPFTLNSGSPENPCSHASSYSLERESNGAIDHVTKRAISTPEKSISDVTFGAGVSYIGTPRTSFSAKGKFWVSFQGNDILCLSLPDKPPPQPQQWNVKSPARNKDNPTPSRRSLRKIPLKTAN